MLTGSFYAIIIISKYPTETDHHVKFATGTQLDPEPIRFLKPSDPSQPPEAHVGLLRNHHTYAADVPIPHNLGPEVDACHGQANIHFTVVAPPETVEAGDQVESKYISTVKVRVKTIKEGDIAEKIELRTSGDGKGTMTVLLTAKVLKTSQGNPLLKESVHVVSHQHTDESDFTEWPGFSRQKTPEELEIEK